MLTHLNRPNIASRHSRDSIFCKCKGFYNYCKALLLRLNKYQRYTLTLCRLYALAISLPFGRTKYRNHWRAKLLWLCTPYTWFLASLRYSLGKHCVSHVEGTFRIWCTQHFLSDPSQAASIELLNFFRAKLLRAMFLFFPTSLISLLPQFFEVRSGFASFFCSQRLNLFSRSRDM